MLAWTVESRKLAAFQLSDKSVFQKTKHTRTGPYINFHYLELASFTTLAIPYAEIAHPI